MAIRSKYAGHPLLLAASGLFFLSGCYLVYTNYYKPYAQRKHYMRQEELIRPLLLSRNLVVDHNQKNDE